MAKHDHLCPNKAYPEMENCAVCSIISKVRDEAWEDGFGWGWNKGYKKGIEDEKFASKYERKTV